MDELKDSYRRALPARIAELEAARAALTLDAAHAQTLRRSAHALRGSGGTYGFPEISRAAAAVEEAPTGELATHVDTLIALLRLTASGNSESATVGDARTAAARHILLVDDDPAILLMARHLLQSAGYTLHEAADGAAAAALLREHPVELLLMDVMLGEEDGVAVAEQLLRALPAPNVKLIFLTGATRADQVARMKAAGAAGIITKPFDPATFTATVERLAGVSV